MYSHKYSFTILAITISSIMIVNCSSQPAFPKSTIAHIANVEEESTEVLWSVNEVYAQQNDFQPMMSASSGLVCVLGDLVYPPQNTFTCLDSTAGTMAWQKAMGTPNGILLDSDGVYVSQGGIAKVSKFDHTGELDWKLSLTESTVKYMYLFNDQIQLFLLPEKFMVLEKDSGSQVAVVDGERIIYGTGTERFVVKYSLESRSFDLEQINWQLDISSSNLRLAPLFTENLIFVRTGRVKGTLLALDRATGQIFWKTDNTIISNIGYWPARNVLFAFTESGQLLQINMENGEQSVLLNFSPESFILNGDAVVGGYELAFDESKNILFILLGDSRQLFAVKLG
jgi:outer membrane protein assembly factor BamB